MVGTLVGTANCSMPPDSVALQQTVRQYQETVRRQIIQQHLRLALGLRR